VKLDTDCAIDLCRSGLLCRQYLILHVASTTARVQGFGQSSDVAIAYVLGVLQDGDAEVSVVSGAAGAGLSGCAVGWAQLRDRGVESVRFVASPDADLASEVSGVFEGALVLPSLHGLLADHTAGLPSRLLASAAPALEQVCSALTARAARQALRLAASTEWAVAHPAQLAHWSDAVSRLGPFYALPARLRRVLRWADACAAVLQRTLLRALDRHGPFADLAEAESFVAEVLLRTLQRQGPCPDEIGLGLSPAWGGFTAGAGGSRMAAPRL
jgi:transposase-like protein